MLTRKPKDCSICPSELEVGQRSNDKWGPQSLLLLWHKRACFLGPLPLDSQNIGKHTTNQSLFSFLSLISIEEKRRKTYISASAIIIRREWVSKGYFQLLVAMRSLFLFSSFTDV